VPKKSPLTTDAVQSEANLLKPDSGARRIGLDQLQGKTLIETTPMGFVSVNKVGSAEVSVSTIDAACSMALSSKGDLACVGNVCRKLYQLTDGGYVAVDDKARDHFLADAGGLIVYASALRTCRTLVTRETFGSA
jgi:hypothetical protein